jgi:hypothetical protein
MAEDSMKLEDQLERMEGGNQHNVMWKKNAPATVWERTKAQELPRQIYNECLE